MTVETVNIQFTRYRTPAGKPTCCVDLLDGKYCQFLGSRRYGTQSVCMLTSTDIYNYEDMYSEPAQDCLLWSDKSKT